MSVFMVHDGPKSNSTDIFGHVDPAGDSRVGSCVGDVVSPTALVVDGSIVVMWTPRVERV